MSWTLLQFRLPGLLKRQFQDKNFLCLKRNLLSAEMFLQVGASSILVFHRSELEEVARLVQNLVLIQCLVIVLGGLQLCLLGICVVGVWGQRLRGFPCFSVGFRPPLCITEPET